MDVAFTARRFSLEGAVSQSGEIVNLRQGIITDPIKMQNLVVVNALGVPEKYGADSFSKFKNLIIDPIFLGEDLIRHCKYRFTDETIPAEMLAVVGGGMPFTGPWEQVRQYLACRSVVDAENKALDTYTYITDGDL